MITDTILHKYLRAIGKITCENNGLCHIDAIEVALRLALEELAESIPSTPSTSSTELAALQTDLERLQTAANAEVADLRSQLAQLGTANLRAMELQADLERLQTDADAEVADLRSQLAQLGTANLRAMELQADLERLQTAADTKVAELRKQLNELDADNAALIRRNKELVDSLHISQNGTGLAVKNPPFVDPAPSAISNQQSPINNSMWTDPNMLNTLDDIARDWWIGCAAGRHQWRSVPKPIQLQLVRHVLSFGPETGSMKMTDFDSVKPDWMPGSGSHTKTLSLSWQQLNDWSVEL